jgi:hypothetical protein
MVLNNSKTAAYTLLQGGTSSVEHAAITSSEVAAAALQIADQEDQQAIDQVAQEWNAAKLKHRLAKASAKHIRRRIDNRNPVVLQADLTLRVLKRALYETLVSLNVSSSGPRPNHGAMIISIVVVFAIAVGSWFPLSS